MSLTLLSEKLDKLNEKEKVIRMTYDVRGTNKHQHRYIKDLKQDFKEDLELRYGNKPYGLGWNQDSEIETERDADNLDEDADEPIPEDDEDIEKENGDIMGSAISPNSNFRPMSGKVSSFAGQNRPFSASTIRPVTASSAGGNGFMFQNRPISAISHVKRHFGGASGPEVGESTLSMKSPQSMHQALSNDDLARMQASNVTLNQSTKLKASESIFWKNTKKFDVAQSTKQFYTKQLVFDMPHMDPKLINSTDLAFLKADRMQSALNSSKLKAPENHEFQDVAKKRVSNKKANLTTGGGEADLDTQPDAKSIFNQSLSYIQSLRGDPKGVTNILSEDNNSNNKGRKHQRPMTAHPMISTSAATITNNLKKPLETVKEHVPGNSRIYFSSLSDLRKKAFFLKLHSLELATLNHPSLSKEIKLIDWECFKDLPNQPDFQSLHLLIIDLNSFDHTRYELEFTKSGRVQAKDKEELREVLDVYKDFLNATRTNITCLQIYYEAANNCMLEVFSRVLVYEKQENEYDLIVWRNIYRYLLYKISLANAPLYPDCKTYQDFSKMIKDIIEDKRDYVSPISSQIQQTKDHPIVVERNSHVYNFDFHSYILECSSYYAQSLQRDPTKPEPSYKPSRKESKGAVENQKARPYSAVGPGNKFSMFGSMKSPKIQDSTLKETSTTFDPFSLLAPQRPGTSYNNTINTMNSSARNNGSKDRLVATLGNMAQGGTQHILPMNRRSVPRSPEMKDVRVQQNVDFTVQGGRMDIYPDMWAASSNAKSKWKNTMMSTSLYSPDFKKFSSSAMQTPQGFEGMMFQPDSNGVIVKQNVNTMKKHTNVVVHRRPYSAQKKPIEPHKMSGGIPITMFLSANGSKSNSRTKF